MSEQAKPSQYDQGEDNWHAKNRSFNDWLAADKPSKIIHDKRAPDEMRRRLYQDRSSFEPEFV